MGMLDRLSSGVGPEAKDEASKSSEHTTPLGETLGRIVATPPGAVKLEHPEWFGERGQFTPGNRLSKRARIRIADLSAMAREATDGGVSVVETLVEVMAGLEPLPVRDTDKETGEVIIRRSKATPTAADRVQAAKILKTCIWGRDPTVVEVHQGSSEQAAFDISRLTPAQVRAYLEIRRAARGELPADVVVVDVTASEPGNRIENGRGT
jgi:hypothetical protein